VTALKGIAKGGGLIVNPASREGPCPHCGRRANETASSETILMKVPLDVYPHLQKVYELMVRHGGSEVFAILTEALVVAEGTRRRDRGR
jgi:hypothetical protein